MEEADVRKAIIKSIKETLIVSKTFDALGTDHEKCAKGICAHVKLEDFTISFKIPYDLGERGLRGFSDGIFSGSFRLRKPSKKKNKCNYCAFAVADDL